LEAQVIDIKDNKVYIHYNGWGTRWDEWIDMDSDRIMPFRYHTRQTSFSNYHSPFPNVKPDANVNIYNNTTNNTNTSNDNNFNILNNENQHHQFYDFFNDLNDSFNNCKEMFMKINENREFIRKNGFINSNINKKNMNQSKLNINNIKEDSLNNPNIINFSEELNNNNNNDIIVIPKIKEEKKSREDDFMMEDRESYCDIEKINKIKQREIFFYSKQLSPLLDRLGRVMTDMGQYMYHNMKNNKLEE